MTTATSTAATATRNEYDIKIISIRHNSDNVCATPHNDDRADDISLIAKRNIEEDARMQAEAAELQRRLIGTRPLGFDFGQALGWHFEDYYDDECEDEITNRRLRQLRSADEMALRALPLFVGFTVELDELQELFPNVIKALRRAIDGRKPFHRHFYSHSWEITIDASPVKRSEPFADGDRAGDYNVTLQAEWDQSYTFMLVNEERFMCVEVERTDEYGYNQVWSVF